MPLVLLPFNDNILLEGIEAKKTTEGGLYLPENVQHAPPQGKVIEKGPLVSENVQKGDILFYPHSSEAQVDYKGKKFKMVCEQAVLGVIREMTDEQIKLHQEVK